MKVQSSLKSFVLGVGSLLALHHGALALELKPKHINIGMDFGGKSHVKYLFEISTTLKERGHEISYVTYDDNLRFANGYNITHYSLGPSIISASEMRSQFSEILNSKNADTTKIMTTNFMELMHKSYVKAFPEFIRFFIEQKPDLVICDFFSQACCDAARKQKIPLIVGFQSIDTSGSSSAPYITRTFDSAPTTLLDMSFWQRFYYKVWMPAQMMYMFFPMIQKMNQLRAEFHVPPTNNPFGNWDNALLIANTYFNFENSRPLASNMKLIGPIITPNPTPISDELREFIDSHDKTVFVAFGSNVPLNDFHIKQIMEGALLAMNNGAINGIVWGLGRTEPQDFPDYFDQAGQKISSKLVLSGHHPNIRILSWAPQQSLLSEPNVRVFISHGGLESTFEALHSATPILSYPYAGDQPRNGRRVQELGVGYFVDRSNTNSEEISEKLEKIVRDETGSISRNLRKMQVLSHLGSRRQTYAADIIEEYAYTAEVCRNSESQPATDVEDNDFSSIPCEIEYLIPVGERMSFIKANAIDVYAVAILIVLGMIISFVAGLYMLFSKTRQFYSKNALSAHKQKKTN